MTNKVEIHDDVLGPAADAVRQKMHEYDMEATWAKDIARAALEAALLAMMPKALGGAA